MKVWSLPPLETGNPKDMYGGTVWGDFLENREPTEELLKKHFKDCRVPKPKHPRALNTQTLNSSL